MPPSHWIDFTFRFTVVFCLFLIIYGPSEKLGVVSTSTQGFFTCFSVLLSFVMKTSQYFMSVHTTCLDDIIWTPPKHCRNHTVRIGKNLLILHQENVKCKIILSYRIFNYYSNKAVNWSMSNICFIVYLGFSSPHPVNDE